MHEANTYVDLVPNASLGHYTIVEHIADGGMGHVFRGFEPSLQREVAIKVLKKEFASDQEVLRQFEMEAQNIAALRHPNIVPIYFVGQQGELYYFVMPFISGETLDVWGENGARLNLEEARWVLYQAIDALDRAFSQNIIHMDIKPSNFLVDENGVILLTDFGLARVLGSAVDEDSEDCFGTPAYMCPEQIMRQVTDQRSDIYSLGASLYHMMTCEFLFLTDTIAELIRAHLDEAFPYKRAENSGLPPGWIHLLEKMTRKKPEERYQTYVELREALDNVDRLAPVQINTTDDTSVLDNPDRLPIPTQAGSRENIHGLLGDRYASWSQTGLEDGISRSKDEVMDKISKPGMQVNELVPALRELNQDDVLEMSDLASAVAMIPEVDEFISALARSEFVSCSTVIETRRQAIRQVSLELSRKILLTHMMIKEFSKKEKEFSWQPYWQYCIATGVIAHFIHKMLMSEYLPGKGNIETKSKRTITGALRRHSLNKADIILFSAALTHGIGKLILAEIAAYPYYSVLSKAIENQDLLSNEEQKVFSCDHHEAGEKWLQVHRFDSQMRQAATNYNSLETYDGIVPGLVAVASHVVRIYGIGYGGDPVIQTRDIWNTPVWENLAAQCKTIELTPDYMEQELIPLVGTIPTYQY